MEEEFWEIMLHFLDLGQDLRSQRESVLPSLQGGCMADNRHVMFIIPHLQVMCSSSSCSKTCALLYHQHRYHPHHQYQVLSLYICKACVPLFESRGGGSAVFVSSIGGFQVIPLDHHHQYHQHHHHHQQQQHQEQHCHKKDQHKMHHHSFQPIPMLGPYSVSKTALFGLTKALAAEVIVTYKRSNQ